MTSDRSVLIVDRSEETREVLQTALERRGMRTYATGRARRGIELARRVRPDLIVLDLDEGSVAAEEFCAPSADQGEVRPARLICLGGLCSRGGAPAGGEFILKPYHFGPLIRRIEELLRRTGRAYARTA